MLSDCISKNPAETELFIVQSREVAASARAVRDRFTQAVLELEGSIVDGEVNDFFDVQNDSDFQTIVATLGVGVCLTADQVLNLKGLRYRKVVLVGSTVTDVLPLMRKYFRPLSEEGVVYEARLPLGGLSQEEFESRVMASSTRSIVHVK